MIRAIPALLPLALWALCVIDVIRADEFRIRHLPKSTWILIVLFFPLIGGVAWLVAGRPEGTQTLTREQGAAPGFPEYERPGRFAAADPEQDEEFLRKIKERAEEQRRAYQERKRLEAEDDQ